MSSENNNEQYWRNDQNKNALSGSELMMTELEARMPEKLMNKFQFTLSRVRELDPNKIRIFWAHDLPNDPESINGLAGGLWQRFHKLIFVSHWQQQMYIEEYGIPWSRTAVLKNAIDTSNSVNLQRKFTERQGNPVKLIYHTTPHRGLHLLVPVLEQLEKEGITNWELDVYSSFQIYGWKERDADLKEIFAKIDAHPRMRNHGTVSNAEVRSALGDADIFSYPNIWTETSCRSLIEAMASGCVCVHPNFGALPETAGGWTFMYPFHEREDAHARQFHESLRSALKLVEENSEALVQKLNMQKAYAEHNFSWDLREQEWKALLEALAQSITKEEDINFPKNITPTGKHKIFRYFYDG